MQNMPSQNDTQTTQSASPAQRWLTTYAKLSLDFAGGDKYRAISWLKRFLAEAKRLIWSDEAQPASAPLDVAKAQQLQQQLKQLQQTSAPAMTSTPTPDEKLQPE